MEISSLFLVILITSLFDNGQGFELPLKFLVHD